MANTKKYIIVTRVLSQMSEAARKIWEKYPVTTENKTHSIEIIKDVVQMFDGYTLCKEDWEKIISDKPNEKADKHKIGESLGLRSITQDTVLFIHFGGQDDQNVRKPLKKLQNCFDSDKVKIIPFTINASAGGVLETAKFLDNQNVGDLKFALDVVTGNYIAQEGIFGWLSEYESALLVGKAFKKEIKKLEVTASVEEIEEYEKYEKKFKGIEVEFNEFIYELKQTTTEKIPSSHAYIAAYHLKYASNRYVEKIPEEREKALKFKLGVWDTHTHQPKALSIVKFEKQVEQFRKIVGYANIVSPREEVFDAWLIVHELKSLQKSVHTTESLDKVSAEFLKNPKPVLSVGLLPLWNYDKKREDGYREAETPQCLAFREQYFDARVRFWDSCIWFRYVPLLREDWATHQKGAFVKVISELQDYKDRGLYDTISAREFLAFQLRLYHNSFVSNVSYETNRAHGGAVTPFGFHSETKMEREALYFMEKIEKCGCEWRVLLVDDNTGENALKTIDNKGQKDKKAIITEAFRDTVFMDLVNADDEYPSNELDKKDSFMSAKKALEDTDKHYDIILLDYLFQKEAKNTFGIEFLKTIISQSKYLQPDVLGPLDKHWIIPISVYQNTLIDSLNDAAILTRGENWVITQGTDPLNKPHLFRFVLLRLMSRQLDEALFMDDIVKSIMEAGDDIQNTTRKTYSKIILAGSKLSRLQRFYRKSPFVKKVLLQGFQLEEDVADDNGMNEITILGQHFQNLFMLISNGNTQYKPQMWEEYFGLKRLLKKDDVAFWNAIKKYIEKV